MATLTSNISSGLKLHIGEIDQLYYRNIRCTHQNFKYRLLNTLAKLYNKSRPLTNLFPYNYRIAGIYQT